MEPPGRAKEGTDPIIGWMPALKQEERGGGKSRVENRAVMAEIGAIPGTIHAGSPGMTLV
jgi:hypothetical protein